MSGRYQEMARNLINLIFLVILAQAAMRAPCVIACAMRSLAIVITIVQSFSLSFFFSVFCFLLSFHFYLLFSFSIHKKKLNYYGIMDIGQLYFESAIGKSQFLLCDKQISPNTKSYIFNCPNNLPYSQLRRGDQFHAN